MRTTASSAWWAFTPRARRASVETGRATRQVRPRLERARDVAVKHGDCSARDLDAPRQQDGTLDRHHIDFGLPGDLASPAA
jgi:hypothetical protein